VELEGSLFALFGEHGETGRREILAIDVGQRSPNDSQLGMPRRNHGIPARVRLAPGRSQPRSGGEPPNARRIPEATREAPDGQLRRCCARACQSRRTGSNAAGLDITVHQSDTRRAPGHLSRQGPPALRWALFEAAQCARRISSLDHDYYQQAAERLGGNRACLAVARKLLKRSYHTLRELGEEALQPA
jgi:hypothetical protein